jgi:hypothetical protein
VETPSSEALRRHPLEVAWASLTFFVPMIVSLLSKMGAIDLAYHIRAGEDVLHGNIPRFDTYTFTVAGAPWLDQQWLAQGVFALVYKTGGWPLLLALQAVLVGLTFWFVYLAARATGAKQRTASLLTLAGFLVASPGLGMRPQLLALPLFGALLWVTAGRNAHPARLWLAPALALICANLHGSFTLFPLIVFLAWLEDVRSHDPAARRTLLIVAATAAATLVNPFGIGAWTYAFDLSTNPVIRKTISEWAPLTLATVPGWFAIVSAFAVVAYLVRRTRPTPWTTLVTLGLFFLLALSAQRAIVWWGMVAPVMLASLMQPAPEAQRDGTSEPQAARGPAYVIMATLIAGVIVLAPWWRGTSYDKFLVAAPPGLTDATRGSLAPGTRTLVYQPWGSWFEFALPDIPVFVDSRIEIIPEDIWHDYGEVGFSGASWQEVLDRWNVEAIVASKDWDLLPILERSDSGWREIYSDDDGALLVRT